MSWFSREGERPSTAAGAGAAAEAPLPRTTTLVARGTRFEGRLTGATEVQVDGEVAGEVSLEGLLVVAPGGHVTAPVTARVVRVAGRVAGPVKASERVEVLPSGVLEGDVAAPRVTIAEGAFVKGKVEMGVSPREPKT